MRRVSMAVAMSLLAGCAASGPRPIAYDADACEKCHMQISDTRFGGEVETRTGKLYLFDAVDCLLDFERSARRNGDVRTVWVIDYRSPKSFVAADSAWFVVSDSGRSPMGRGIYATATEAGAAEIRAQVGGDIKRWSDLQ